MNERSYNNMTALQFWLQMGTEVRHLIAKNWLEGDKDLAIRALRSNTNYFHRYGELEARDFLDELVLNHRDYLEMDIGLQWMWPTYMPYSVRVAISTILAKGEKIQAIKFVRDWSETGQDERMGLKEAKDFIESLPQDYAEMTLLCHRRMNDKDFGKDVYEQRLASSRALLVDSLRREIVDLKKELAHAQSKQDDLIDRQTDQLHEMTDQLLEASTLLMQAASTSMLMEMKINWLVKFAPRWLIEKFVKEFV